MLLSVVEETGLICFDCSYDHNFVFCLVECLTRFVCLPMSVCISVCLYICFFGHLSVCLSVYLSVCHLLKTLENTECTKTKSIPCLEQQILPREKSKIRFPLAVDRHDELILCFKLAELFYECECN